MKNDKIVLITGCSSGFGNLAAITIAQAGYPVYAGMREISGRNRQAAEKLENLAKKDNLSLHVIELDVTDPESAKAAVTKIESEAGRVDVLINNAGTLYSGVTEAFTEEQVRQQFETNVISVVRMNRAVLPGMRKRRRGLLMHVTSVIGRVVFPFDGIYCASKFAVEAIAESLRYELADLGVDSVILEPSAYPTPIGSKVFGPDDTKCATEYGAVNKHQDQLVSKLTSMFTSAAAPDPQEVADAMLNLIELPDGERPLRTIVGDDFEAMTVNAAAAAAQREVLKNLGLATLAQLKTTLKASEKL
jgi:NADP-dependent 3-hydroxy acid dehydrogenase YdfG